jgi:hypothetical protein
MVQVTASRIEARGSLGTIEELMTDEPIAMLGQFDEAFVFAGLSLAGIDTQVGFELIGAGKTLDRTDAVDSS